MYTAYALVTSSITKYSVGGADLPRTCPNLEKFGLNYTKLPNMLKYNHLHCSLLYIHK